MKNLSIIGAITGDVFGSVYEWENHKSTDFNLICHIPFSQMIQY